MMEEIPVALFEQMKAKGIVYTPTLSVYEAMMLASSGNFSMFDRSLVQQVGPASLLQSSRDFVKSGKMGDMTSAAPYLKQGYENARKNLLRALQTGVQLATGTDAGNPGVIHGPTVQRELELWVEAGVPAAEAIKGATVNAAKLLGAGNRMGRLEKGYEATLVVLEANPLRDIAATEQVSSVLLKGERIDRAGLFEDDRKKK
jgi:imidazolonepropionase-like amidohydrolase